MPPCMHIHMPSETHKKPFLIPCRNEHFKISCDFARASFNCGATKIACGSADGTIYIWNVNGFLETTLKGHRCVVTCSSSYGHFYVHQSCDRFTIYLFICYPIARALHKKRRSDPIRSLLFPTSVDNPNVLICLYFTARPLTQSAGARTATRWRRWARAKDVSSIPIRSPLEPQVQVHHS